MAAAKRSLPVSLTFQNAAPHPQLLNFGRTVVAGLPDYNGQRLLTIHSAPHPQLLKSGRTVVAGLRTADKGAALQMMSAELGVREGVQEGV